ncbi:MAG: hypothetical protein JST44_26995, partial [Cyanobacteria bacterium SZAS LIN-5]|nr:hypothetical protein [Cyanobacteria bacterium SZAS LIN-5]
MPKLGNRDTKKWKWWTRTLAKFEQSEMTLPEFCRINRITYATACEWRRKIGEDNAKSVESMPTPVRRRGRKPKVANDATPVCQSVEDKFVSVNVIDDELI